MPRSLRHINFAIVFRILGWLLGIEAIFMCIPGAVGCLYGESDGIAFFLGAAITALSGMALSVGLRRSRRDMGKYEAFLLTVLLWVVFSVFSAVPLLLCGHPLSITDAFFESMSGFTTTGSTAIASVDGLSRTVNLWRCLIEWVGGMGIILFLLAVIPMLNHSGGMQMFNAEVTGITHEKLRPRVSQTAKGLWGVYVLLTAVLIGLLCLGPMSLYDSACHAFSALSTGGFSTHADSMQHFHSTYSDIVVMIFMFLGGTNFALIYKLLHGDPAPIWRNTVFRVYVGIIFGAYLLVALSVWLSGNACGWESLTVDPMFQVISAISTTGFMVCDTDGWGSLVHMIMLLLMFSGACAGSTTGGAKVDRMIVLVKHSLNEIYRCLHPNTICSVRFGGKVLSPETVSKVVAFFCLQVLVMIVGASALSAMGMTFGDSCYAAFSCITNTDVIGGYNLIPDAGKWLMTLLMLIGRLEIFTVLILFTRSFWTKS